MSKGLIEHSFTLPSKGKFYDEFNGEMVIRNITTDDERLIFGSSSNKTLDRAISSCIVEPKGFDINSLIPGDKQFVLIQERIHTYGSSYKQDMYCVDCKGESLVEYDLGDIECHFLDDNFKVPLRVKLPKSKDLVELNVLNVNQITALKDRARKVASKTGADYGEVFYQLKQAKNINSINDKKIDSFEAESYIKDMNPLDRAYIKSAYNSIKLGYEAFVEVKCPKCGAIVLIPFQMTGEFFSPSLEVKFL